MKLLYTAITLLIFVGTTSTGAFHNSNTLTPEEHLVNYYKKECNKLAGDVCIQLENIVKHLLNDKINQESNSPALKLVKRSLIHFQEIYPHYMRFGLNETLAKTFSNMMDGWYHSDLNADKDPAYLLQKLKKLGYDGIREKYNNNFRQFVSQKFSPKFEELKKQFKNKSARIEFETKFSKLINKWKHCSEYECYLNSFEEVRLTPRDKFVNYIKQQMRDLTVFRFYNATLFTKRVLHDPRLAELSSALRQQLTQNIVDFITIFGSLKNIYEIFFLRFYYIRMIEDYYKDRKISLNEHELVKNIFDSQGYGQIEQNYKIKYNEFLEHDVLKEFEHFKASVGPEELAKEKALVVMFDRLKRATTYEERVNAVDNWIAL